jgi:hypothetical protein
VGFEKRLKGWHVKQRHVTAGYNYCTLKVFRKSVKRTLDCAPSAGHLILIGDGCVREESFDVIRDVITLVANHRDYMGCAK